MERKKIALSSIIEGTIYYRRTSSFDFINKKGKDQYLMGYIDVENKRFNPGGTAMPMEDEVFEATELEKEWLEMCIKMGKFVPITQVRPELEIFN